MTFRDCNRTTCRHNSGAHTACNPTNWALSNACTLCECPAYLNVVPEPTVLESFLRNNLVEASPDVLDKRLLGLQRTAMAIRYGTREYHTKHALESLNASIERLREDLKHGLRSVG